jgi:hypothetical protein
MNIPETRHTSSLVDIDEATEPGTVMDPVMHGGRCDTGQSLGDYMKVWILVPALRWASSDAMSKV